MPIRGTIEKGGIIDIIQMIALGMKTGVLNVTDNIHLGAIYFENGKIVYCSIVNKEEKIGDKLVKQEIITEKQLKEALAIQKEYPDKRIGDILLSKGYITQDLLEKALIDQIEDSLFTILTWKEGKFNFEPNIKPIDTGVLISMDVNRILLKEGKRIDEWSIIEQYIPSFDTIPEKVEGNKINILVEEERAVFNLIDGRHSIEDIIEKTTLPRFTVAKIIMRFIKQGYITIGDKRKVHVDKDLKKQMEESLKLSIAFFAAEMYDESLEKIEDVLALDPLHTEALFHKSRIKILKEDYEGVIEDLNVCLEKGIEEWYIFNNIAIVYENRKEYALAEEYYLKAITKAEDKYRGMVYANMGVNAYKSGRYTDAMKYFKGSLDNSFNSPLVYLFWANTYVHIQDYKSSVDILNKGIVKYPSFWQLHYTLGVILEGVGANIQCEIAYKQAIKFIPEGEIRPMLAMANYYYKKKELNYAKEWYERIIKYKKDVDIFLKLGNMAFQKGETDIARKWWNDVLSVDPNNRKARKNLSFLVGKNGTKR